MESATLPQPKRVETTLDARCGVHGVVYRETTVEVDGRPLEVQTSGTFRRALDEHGAPTGPVIPFCPVCKES